MSLLFFQSIGNTSSKASRRIGESGQGMGHDLDGKKLMACEPMQTNRAVLFLSMRLKGREFFLFFPPIESHMGRAGRLIEKERLPGSVIGQNRRTEKLLFEGGPG
jgi:hypothetical protein